MQQATQDQQQELADKRAFLGAYGLKSAANNPVVSAQPKQDAGQKPVISPARRMFERKAKAALEKWLKLKDEPTLRPNDKSDLEGRAKEMQGFLTNPPTDYKAPEAKCLDFDLALDDARKDIDVRVYVENYDKRAVPDDADKQYADLALLFERFRTAVAEVKFAREPVLLHLIGRAELAAKEGRFGDAFVAATMAKEYGEQAQKEMFAKQTAELEAKQKAEAEAWAKRCQEFVKNGGGLTASSLAKVDQGDLGELKQVCDEVFSGKLTLEGAELSKLKTSILKGVLENPARFKAVAADVKLSTALVSEAAVSDGVKVTSQTMKALGDKEQDVAAKVLLQHCADKNANNAEVVDWMWKTVTPEQWKDKKKGISSQVLNNLWNAGDFEKIDQLLKDKDKGVDPGQPYSLGFNRGRGTREGEWSGYIQPMEHLLGNYVKKVSRLKGGEYHKELDALNSEVQTAKAKLDQAKIDLAKLVPPTPEQQATPNQQTKPDLQATPRQAVKVSPEVKEQLKKAAEVVKSSEKAFQEKEADRDKKSSEIEKLKGAQRILEALNTTKKASVLTDYEDIKKSPMIATFQKEPGTIWGFEDVRMPYVQAARETEHGQKPLRMWEMWEAIDPALDEKGYSKLLEDPDTAIPEFIKMGVDKIKKGMHEKGNHEYEGRDETEFIKRFEEQATMYLRHLSKQPPKGEFQEVADPSGVNPGKLMGALGCKAGLWWAKEKKPKPEPVYYCIDGINMADATSYKRLRNSNIKAKLDNPSKAVHYEVITFAEIREILKNWDELKDTVKFFEKGKMFGPEDMKRVEQWIADMKGHDKDAGKRPAPKAEKYKALLDKLDPQLINNLHEKESKDGRDADRNALRIARASENLKRAARAKTEVLLAYLDSNQCAVLVEWGFVPEGLQDTYRQAISAASDELRASQVELLKKQIALVNGEFRAAISKTLLAPFPLTI